MVLFKRFFFLLLGVLGTLLLDADLAYGLSKEEAIKKCEGRIIVLEQQTYRCGDKIPENFFKFVLTDLKRLLEELRKSEEPPRIMSYYTTCQEGLTAMEWILSQHGKPARVEAKPEIKPEVTPSIEANAPKVEVVPVPPPVIQRANIKKKAISKLAVVKVHKKLKVKKTKPTTMKARYNKVRKARKSMARTA